MKKFLTLLIIIIDNTIYILFNKKNIDVILKYRTALLRFIDRNETMFRVSILKPVLQDL